MITNDELMDERRTMLMSLMRDKRCTSLRTTLGAALNDVTAWLRSANHEDYAAFNTAYSEACRAIDDALELTLVPLDVAIYRSRTDRPDWLNERGAA